MSAWSFHLQKRTSNNKRRILVKSLPYASPMINVWVWLSGVWGTKIPGSHKSFPVCLNSLRTFYYVTEHWKISCDFEFRNGCGSPFWWELQTHCCIWSCSKGSRKQVIIQGEWLFWYIYGWARCDGIRIEAVPYSTACGNKTPLVYRPHVHPIIVKFERTISFPYQPSFLDSGTNISQHTGINNRACQWPSLHISFWRRNVGNCNQAVYALLRVCAEAWEAD